MKKKTLGIIAASAFAIAALGAPATAANDKACFGQLHQAVNNDPATQAFLLSEFGITASNVGDLVQALPGKGQDKKAVGRGLVC